MSKLVSSAYPFTLFFQVFDGNSDRNTVKENKLEVPIYTRYVRLHPKTFHNHISMRLELHGCQTGAFLIDLRQLPSQEFIRESEKKLGPGQTSNVT